MMDLRDKKCLPCEGGVPALPAQEAERLLRQLPGWSIDPEQGCLRKRYKFRTFKEAISFVNRMADLAEAEGHHPDFCVRFTVLEVSLITHAIGGLSENDFILAAKIEDS